MLKIVTEIESGMDLENFEFWSGGKDRFESLTPEDIDTIFEYLDGEEMTDTQLNDFFWFEDNTYAEWLGYNSAEELWADRD